MRLWRILMGTLGSVALLLSTFPADAGAPVTLDIKTAIQMALERNLTVQSARQAVEGARGQKRAAYGATSPALGLRGTAGSYGGVERGPDQDASASLVLSETLFAGGKLKARRDQASLTLAGAADRLIEAEETVAFQVWRAFCDVEYRAEVLHTADEALNYYVQLEKELSKRVEYGLATNLDLTRVRQQREQARAARISAANDLAVSRIALATLLRLSPETRIELKGSLADGLPTVAWLKANPQTGPDVLAKALTLRGDYLALRKASQSADREITAAASGLKPGLIASGSYRFAYDGSGGMGDIDRKDQWQASLTLSVPLYDGGLTSGQVVSARAQKAQADQAVEASRDAIRAQIEDAGLAFASALSMVDSGRQNLTLAQESLRYAEIGYREGVNTQLDVLQARTALTQAGEALAGYLRDGRVAQAQLWQARGVLVDRVMTGTANETKEVGQR